MTGTLAAEQNWAGNYTYRAQRLHRPTSLPELQEVLAAAPRVRVLGSRHSFTDIADSDELVSVEALDAGAVVDRAAGTVTVGAGMRYGDLVDVLDAEGLALHNLASLPHISVGGAIATATHGSGVRNGNLATAVAGLELVTSGGEVVRTSRGDPDFDGMVVGLGALGALTRVTLDVQPAYEVEQRVFERLSWDAFGEHVEEIAAAAYSVSFFTHWGECVDQVWCKRRTTDAPVGDELFGARPATAPQHPTGVRDPAPCTPQLGRPGSWADRLPHFQMGFTPSTGAEIQTEYLFPRRHVGAAVEAVRGLADRIRPLLEVTEIRTVAADELWMSTSYRQDCAAFHFTWKRDQDAVERVVAQVEEALAPFDARPHWGKVFHADAAALAPLYPRHADFLALVARLDPRGAFRNRWFERRVLGTA